MWFTLRFNARILFVTCAPKESFENHELWFSYLLPVYPRSHSSFTNFDSPVCYLCTQGDIWIRIRTFHLNITTFSSFENHELWFSYLLAVHPRSHFNSHTNFSFEYHELCNELDTCLFLAHPKSYSNITNWTDLLNFARTQCVIVCNMVGTQI